MGDVVARPDPTPQTVREPHRGVVRSEVRHPGRELELVAYLYVLRRLFGARQVLRKPPRAFEAQDVFYGVFSLREETFDGVI